MIMRCRFFVLRIGAVAGMTPGSGEVGHRGAGVKLHHRAAFSDVYILPYRKSRYCIPWKVVLADDFSINGNLHCHKLSR